MFRPTKRTKPRRVLTRRDEDDSDDDKEEKRDLPRSRTRKRPKAQLTAKSSLLSFGHDEEEEEGNEKNMSKKKKKQKRKGMGFGGAAPIVVEDEEEQEETKPSLYHKDSLSKLKSEQKVFVATTADTETKTQKTEDGTAVDGANGVQSETFLQPKHDALNADYVSMTNQNEGSNIILAGDEALHLEETGRSLNNTQADSTTTREIDHSPDDDWWQDEVARRAGIKVQRNQGTPASTDRNTIAQLKEKISSTLQHLKVQRKDLGKSRERRQEEFCQTQEELNRQQFDIKESGKALEFYQDLRLRLVQWVEALREMDSKVEQVFNATMEFYKEVGETRQAFWQKWEDDTIEVLTKEGLVSQVIGREPLVDNEPHVALVDEFGRDMKSMQTLERENRSKTRGQVLLEFREQNELEGGSVIKSFIESSIDCTRSDLAARQQRQVALDSALDFATVDVDDEFESIEKLIDLFDEWYSNQPEDYVRSYADIILGDLGKVLMRKAFLRDWNPLNAKVGGLKKTVDFPCMARLQQMRGRTAASNRHSKSTTADHQTPWERIVDKFLVPTISQLTNEGSYDAFSLEQTEKLSSYFVSVLRSTQPGHKMHQVLVAELMNCLRKAIEELSVPILHPVQAARLLHDNTSSNDVKEAVRFALYGPLGRMRLLTVNILRHWVGPFTAGGDEKEIQKMVLVDLISLRLLPALSMLRDFHDAANDNENTDKETFCSLWQELANLGWLTDPSTMLFAAPIRALAPSYGKTDYSEAGLK